MDKQVTLANEKNAATERYASLLNNVGENKSWLQTKRNAAMESFRAQGFPTSKNEEWKFTDVRAIADLNVQQSSTRIEVDAESYSIPNLEGHRLVFVNGIFDAAQSHIGELPNGVTLTNLANAIATDNEVVQEHLNRYAATTQDSAFTQLNTALMQDGVFLHVSQNVQIEQPIHVLFLGIGGDETPLSSTRNLLIIGAESRVQIIEHYAGEGVYLTNTVTEVVAGKNADIDHVKLQLESLEAFHISTLQVMQERDCRFASHNIDMGGRLVRNNGQAVMGGANIECTLNGLYVVGGNQHVDNHTAMDHAQPNCNSYEIYAGVLGGSARGVFNGKIFVRRDAQKTDAKQTNRNLLLSGDAMINTKPQLEILADDVKCTHGCTIGQLDEEALFYLRSRGLNETTARNLLIYAFANDVINGIEEEPVRTFMEAKLLHQLERIGVDESAVAA